MRTSEIYHNNNKPPTPSWFMIYANLSFKFSMPQRQCYKRRYGSVVYTTHAHGGRIEPWCFAIFTGFNYYKKKNIYWGFAALYTTTLFRVLNKKCFICFTVCHTKFSDMCTRIAQTYISKELVCMFEKISYSKLVSAWNSIVHTWYFVHMACT